MTRISHLLLTALVCSMFSPVYAQQASDQPEIKYYDVEVIVFKNIKVPRSHEYNLPTPSASRTEKTLDLSNPRSIKKAGKIGFTPLKLDELRLSDSVQSIIKSSRYSLLLHTGWRQPGLDEASSIPVWVKGGKIYDSSYSSIDQMTQFNSSKDDTNPAISNTGLTSRMRGLYELEGQITIILSRYLHTKTELVLRKPASVNTILQQGNALADNNESELLSMEGQLLLNYGLNEQRRMRSKKLHYLDHPEFGMLVLITPYEAAEESIIEQPELQQTPTGAQVENSRVNSSAQ